MVRLRRDMMLDLSDSRELPLFDSCLAKVIGDGLC